MCFAKNLRDTQVKIVFLDIDGVLCTRDSYRKMRNHYGEPNFEKNCVSAFNNFISQSNCKIVVSSSWRVGKSVQALQAVLKSQGVLGEVIDKTPELSSCRGSEILLWLQQNNLLVSSFVILDDDIFDIEDYFPNRYIQTDMEFGFQEIYIPNALEILKSEMTLGETDAPKFLEREHINKQEENKMTPLEKELLETLIEAKAQLAKEINVPVSECIGGHFEKINLVIDKALRQGGRTG